MSASEIIFFVMVCVMAFAVLRMMGKRKLEAIREQRDTKQPSPDRMHSPPTRERKPHRQMGETADEFRFSPELFEHRANVIEELETQGFSWFSHYSSVDCLHDVHGIEVCGIHEREDATSIREILRRMFPDWRPG